MVKIYLSKRRAFVTLAFASFLAIIFYLGRDLEGFSWVFWPFVMFAILSALSIAVAQITLVCRKIPLFTLYEKGILFKDYLIPWRDIREMVIDYNSKVGLLIDLNKIHPGLKRRLNFSTKTVIETDIFVSYIKISGLSYASKMKIAEELTKINAYSKYSQKEKTVCSKNTGEKIYSDYTVLGIPQGSSLQEIKEAYRTLAFKWHPDKNADQKLAQAKMIEINSAYERLIKIQNI
jgi:hypothetical protein